MSHQTIEPTDIRVLGIDAGGTMTDTIFIDRVGNFVIGKAQTTPDDESVAVAESSANALEHWGTTPRDAFPHVSTGVFSGTSMLNRLVQRSGGRVGAIVTRGMEDALLLERGVQTWLGYSYADIFHVVTHTHHEPLVPRARMLGVGGRIDAAGGEAIPLYENDVREAARRLIDADVDSICVNLLFSWRNPNHEQRTREILLEVMADARVDIPLFLSSERCPKRLDFARLNTLVVEAYAVEPGRAQLGRVRERARGMGARFDLRVMAGFGGTISIDSTQLVNTLVSGPIGGCVGAKYLAEQSAIPNIACADIGGTSFDVALLTNGDYEIKPDPDLAHFKMNFPMVKIDSIGAGTGSFVRVSPISNRIEFGPDSAGSKIGVCNPQADVDTVTISDCDVVLGLINPNYFLGGEVVLDHERAVAAVRDQIARPLGLSLEEAATGVVTLFEEELQRQIQALVTGKGYEAADFVLLGYGGGGPLHTAGFSRGLWFKDILVPSWAAGFSAFGCVCADFAYRLDRQVDIELPADADSDHRERAALAINRVWDDLRDRVEAEFAKSGVPADQIEFHPQLRIQYLGQLNDVEVQSPISHLRDAADLDRVLAAYEEMYERVYSASAKAPELGHFVTLAIVSGTVPAVKPTIATEPLHGDMPPRTALKPSRPVFSEQGWQSAQIYEMDELRAGNQLIGPAIVEAPSTTLVIPDSWRATLDESRIFHLSEGHS